ncbi:MAG: GGDEF domain-containing protein [Candidatus Sumerlaeaceae bacterium]|nr:GGDEF domain-containing protein [Candidatus Sumerlaeaceae bacterium]
MYEEPGREHLLSKYRERFSSGAIEEEVTRDLKLWDGTPKVLHVISRLVKTRDGLMLLSLVADRTEEVRLTRELEHKKKELEQLATHDALTGIKNRRLVLELMQHEVERARRYRFPLCVVMIDIDHFKHVNDTHGHLVGDEVLRQFAKILEENTRAVDIVGRYGGEEFIIVMPETGLDGALVSAERIRTAVENHEFFIRADLVLRITCSLGVTQGDPDMLDIDQLLGLADKALYCAKMEGRNRVSVA